MEISIQGRCRIASVRGYRSHLWKKKSFTLDYIDRIDIKFEPGRETERFYWWMKTNPPAHWSMSEDGSFTLMRFRKMEPSSQCV